MATGCVVRRNEYHDSIFLMRVARVLSAHEGVRRAAALMATDKNKRLLEEIGVPAAEVAAARPDDLVIAVEGDTREAVAAAIGGIDGICERLRAELRGGGPGTAACRTLDDALACRPDANLAVITVPGEYAGREARRALERGLNVFLFSSNVPVETEISLKRLASERGLLVMGPDCGTAIIGGVGLGFANAVRRGPVGVVGASGTGIQEFTALVHRAGSGISHAIGTGSNDPSDAVGGVSTLAALEALEADPATRVIALLSKPPGPATLARIMKRAGTCAKPVVTCFLGLAEDTALAPAGGGAAPSSSAGGAGVLNARTLDDAAALVTRLAFEGESGAKAVTPAVVGVRAGAEPAGRLETVADRERAGMAPGQRYVRGVFAGGTFCYQAQQIMRDARLVVHSNTPSPGALALADPLRSVGHTLVDMGAELFTQGRPHPMIDATLRRERMLAEAQDPEVAVILLDFILGFGCSPDPAGDLVGAIRQAKEMAAARGRHLSVVASVCGTEDDPQGLPGQVRMLEEAGAVVLPSAAQAAMLSALLASGLR